VVAATEQNEDVVNRTSWGQFADAVLLDAAAQIDTATGASQLTRVVGELTRGSEPSGDPVATARAELVESLSAGGPFATLVANAGLTVEEAEVFALCAGIDADVRRQRLVGWLQDDSAQTRPGLDLLGRILGPDHPGPLAASRRSGLSRSALITVESDGPWGARTVGVEPGVLWALVGDPAPDADLPAGVRFLDRDATAEPDTPTRRSVVFVTGPDRIRRRQAAMDIVPGTRFVIGPCPLEDREWRALVREATLRGAAIIVECGDELPPLGRGWIETARHLAWGVTSRLELAVATLPDRPWSEHHAAGSEAGEADWAAAFVDVENGHEHHRHRLTPEQVDRAATIAENLGTGIDGAVRRLASGPIDRLARRVRPRYRWDDLVLDADRTEQLEELVARYRNSSVVYDEWSFPAVPSAGLIALFSGEPGTGKTMSAEVLAGALELDLFVVDLAAVVSKYIGETEKNLEEIFDAASVGNQVLFFDEADSLFGKRTEVSDARDRYANLEVSYLLQRLEVFGGLVVLATNFANNVDPAFLRRIDISIDFVLPELTERRRLWEKSFPQTAPLADEVDLDDLATRFEISGGSIRKASLFAAFLAADAEREITMDLIATAVEREYQKLGRLKPTVGRSL
jgi:AAA+ superfamily predicted ATPase